MSGIDARQAALARLEASRVRLREHLLPSPHGAAHGSADAGWLRQWWRSQPWHSTASLAGEIGHARIAPLIRRHPYAAIGLGALAGALLVATRPWQSRALRVQAKRSVRLAAAWAARQLTRPATQWLIAALAIGKAAQATTAPPAEAPQPSAHGEGDEAARLVGRVGVEPTTNGL